LGSLFRKSIEHLILKEKIAILEEADWVKDTDQDPEEVDRDHREGTGGGTAYKRLKEVMDRALKLEENQE